MRSSHLYQIARGACVTAAGTLALTTLCSCGDDEEKAATPAAEATQATPSNTAPAVDPAAAKDALLEQMIFTIGKLAGERVADPELTEPVREMLALTENYYNTLPAASPQKARLALRIADITLDLTAYAKADSAYDTAQADLNALPEAVRNIRELRRLQSSIYYGKAVSLFSRRQPTEALPWYEKALDSDLRIYQALAPADGEKLPEGSVEPELARAAKDVMSSYRCLGECQFWADDPEEARDTYNKGIDLAKALDKLSPEMSIEYIKLLANLGNLESRVGNKKEALNAWLQAVNFCQRLYASNRNAAIRLQTRRCFESLRPNILTVARELQDDQAAQVENQTLQDTPAAAPAATPEEPTPVPAPEGEKK